MYVLALGYVNRDLHRGALGVFLSHLVLALRLIFIWPRKISGAAARIEHEASLVESTSREGEHIYNLGYRDQSFENTCITHLSFRI